MKKKILLGIGIGIVAVVIVVCIVVGFFLGDVVKAGINTVGPKVTQTALSVDGVSISALTGSVGLDNLVLGNPAEYLAQATNAIRVGKAAVSVAPLSVLSGKIIVKNVEVRDPEINFDGNPLGANNLKTIMANVNAFTVGSSAAPAGTNAPAQTGAAKPGKKLEVDNFLITGATVHFNGATLPLPDIHLTDLGTGPDGITPVDLIKKVLGEVTTATVKAVASSVGDVGKNLGGAASKLGKNLGTNLNGTASQLGKKIGGLFGK